MAVFATAAVAQTQPSAPRTVDVRRGGTLPPAEEHRSTLAVVNFEDGTATPLPFSAAALDSIAPTLNLFPNRRYELHAYSCPDADTGRGSAAMRAAADRAKAMGTFLTANGVRATDIRAVRAGIAEDGWCARVAIVAVDGAAAKPEPVVTAKSESVVTKPEPVIIAKSDSVLIVPEPAAQPAPVPKPQIVTEEFRTLLAVVNFEENSAKPTEFSVAALDSVAAIVRQGQKRRYEVHGFFCGGADGQNRTMRSSAERIEAMVNYLSANGVGAGAISTIIRGSDRAEAKNTDAESCTRVEIVSIEARQREVIPEPEPVEMGIDVDIVGARRALPLPEPEPVPIAEPEPEPKVEPIPPDSQGRPTIAIYMAGEEPQAAKGSHYILGSELARTISESDRYLAVDRTEDIQAQIAKEHIYQREGGVDDDQIKELGMQLGAQYLCIGNIKDVGKRSYYLDVRLVDVVTAEIKRTVTANSNLKDANEKTRIARDIAYELIETDKARAARKRKKVIFLSTAIGLDVLGVGALAYGVMEENNVVREIANDDGPKADRAATRRNVAYAVGAGMIASGVSIHIFF